MSATVAAGINCGIFRGGMSPRRPRIDACSFPRFGEYMGDSTKVASFASAPVF